MKSFKEFLTEKLKPSQYRDIFKKIDADYKTRYKDWFDGKWRIYLNIGQAKQDQGSDLVAPKQIQDLVQSQGYKVDDYKKGIAVAADGKRIIKIGKLIQKAAKDKPEDENIKKVQKDFEQRLSGKEAKSSEGNLVVVSRHPYDIAGQSTDRGWTSCKRLGDGINAYYIPSEIDSGYLVAYEIDNKDLNIRSPKGRILIVPYVNENDPKENFLLPMKPDTYGAFSKEAFETVKKWLDIKQPSAPQGRYKFPEKCYVDFHSDAERDIDVVNPQTRKVLSNGAKTKEEVVLAAEYLKLKEYTINDDLTVDVVGDVDIGFYSKLTKLPIQFGTVSGGFSCSYGKLESLIGSPREVERYFFCNNNELASLKGAPKKVGGSFNCRENELTSLKGAPEKIRFDFDCSHNQLTSLEGAPILSNEVYGGSAFSCAFNEITSLKGAPTAEQFECGHNQLTSLEGAPETVSKSFTCENNKLTSLKGAPKKVGQDFNCDHNEMPSLEGAPKEVVGNFRCVGNGLESLKGAPEKVGGEFTCMNNYLKSLVGAPKEVGKDFNCSSNNLKSLDGAPEKVGGEFRCVFNYSIPESDIEKLQAKYETTATEDFKSTKSFKKYLNEMDYTDYFGPKFVDFEKKYSVIRKKDPKRFKNLYAQFTNQVGDVMSKAPWQTPDHSDPVGIYGYPLSYVMDNPMDINYGSAAKYMRILENVKPEKTLDLQTISKEEVLKLIDQVPELKYQQSHDAERTYELDVTHLRVNKPRRFANKEPKPGAVLFSLVQYNPGGYKFNNEFSPGQKQTQRLLKTGYVSVRDSATTRQMSIINDAEPNQIIFLRRDGFKVVEVYDLKPAKKTTDTSIMATSDKYSDRDFRKLAADIAKILDLRIIGDRKATWDYIYWLSDKEGGHTKLYIRSYKQKDNQNKFKEFKKVDWTMLQISILDSSTYPGFYLYEKKFRPTAKLSDIAEYVKQKFEQYKELGQDKYTSALEVPLSQKVLGPREDENI